MASGWGIKGSVGRCYPFWNAFTECVEKAEERKDCLIFRDDYMECLHHKKEGARMEAIAAEMQRQANPKPDSHGHGGGH
eukprot:CAMPEP_0194584010 /NCGR_PEP_ID=MMETSP0292-20121207/16749_1 /TAXON_ID=39354 /ORGANISM="Heterosigma akashiwo, Strain CCMP2393" /LENGTH=78 /DNA_ID=CAMNT_0039438879 /DNA_START=41 /DNA_END=277 /DNA_ORIENTATION=+